MFKKTFTLFFPVFMLLFCFGITMHAKAYSYVAVGNHNVRLYDGYHKTVFKEQTSNLNMKNKSNTLGQAIKKQHQQIIKSLPYIVQSGDTLYQLSQDFQTSIKTLMQLNHIVNPKSLQIGSHLNIPVTASVSRGLSQLKNKAILEVLPVTLTAYTDGYESTGKTPGSKGYGITASGTVATTHRTIAVDPSVIPMGSIVYIEGVGFRRAEDTGSAIKGNRIDIFMNNVKKALTFGVKRNVPVFVLKKKT